MKIVSNSSPLIALAKIEKLDILRKDVVIPKAVFDEITKPEKEYVKELLDAKERELIREVKPLLEKLMKEKIRISKELYDHALDLANEKRG